MSDASNPTNEQNMPDKRGDNESRPSGPEPAAAEQDSPALGKAANDEQASNEPVQLIAELLCAELSAAGKDRLAQLLSDNPALRAEYQKQSAMHSMLQWRQGNVGLADQDGIDPIAIAELLTEVEQTVQRQAAADAAERATRDAHAAQQRKKMQALADQRASRRPEPIVIPYSVAYLGTAALAASVLWIAYTLFPSNEPPTAIPETRQVSLVATLTESVDARLVALQSDAGTNRGKSVSTREEMHLAAGRYRLIHGVVGLKFNGGASAVIEAPAMIELVSADRVRLAQGRLVGKVPREAIGFTVQTPTASIVDLGTEFGVEVSKEDSADVLVFAGEVNVAAKTDKPTEDVTHRRLTANTSVQVNKTGDFVPSKLRPERFSQNVPSTTEYRRKVAYERWLVYSKALAADPDLVAYYTFDDQNQDDPTLLNRAAATAGRLNGTLGDGRPQASPTWIEGRWAQKSALAFEHARSQVVVVPHDDALNIENQLTVAAWVLPDPNYSNAVIVGKRRGASNSYQLAMFGPGCADKRFAGRIRFDVGTSRTISEIHSDKVLPAGGQWMHLAASFDGKTRRFYLNGATVGNRSVLSSAARSKRPETIGVTIDTSKGTPGGNNLPFSLGYRFNVDTETTLTELGKFDVAGDGLEEDVIVALFNWDTGVKLTEATILAGTPTEETGTWDTHFVDIADVLLSPGTDYLLAVEAQGPDFSFDNTGVTTISSFAPGINFVSGHATYKGSPAMPAKANASTFTIVNRKDTYFGPNFKFGDPDHGHEETNDMGPLTLSYAAVGQSDTVSGFSGRIDELALFRRTMSGDEIKQLYEAGEQQTGQVRRGR